MAVAAGGGGAREEGSSKPKGKPKGTAAVVCADAATAAAAPGKEGGKQEEGMFSFKGQVIAAIVVTAVAGNILGARRFRKTMVDQVARNAQRKAETERMAKAARDRARQARGTEGAGGGGGGGGGGRGGGSGGANASFGGNPLGGGAPDGWEFDDSREPAFREQRLNSQVVQHLSTLGVTNFLAGRAEVQAAYRGRAMHLHPDRSTDDADSVPGGGGSKNANEQEFKRVSAAYAWLDHNYFLRRRPPS